MRQGIGSVALYNIIIIFLFISFTVLAGTMSYSKAFKVNNRIINAIEKYEGYNEAAAEEIDFQLHSIGYQVTPKRIKCSKRNGIDPVSDILNPNYDFCVYKKSIKTSEWNGRYVQYGVVSYIDIDFPIIEDIFKIPVYGTTRKMFEYNPSMAPSIAEVKTEKVTSAYTEFGNMNKNDYGKGIWLTFDHTPSDSEFQAFVDFYSITNNGTKNTLGSLDYVMIRKSTICKDVKCEDGKYKYCQLEVIFDGIVNTDIIYRVLNSFSC